MNILLSLMLCTTSLFSFEAQSDAQGSVVYFHDTICPPGHTQTTYLNDRTIAGQGLMQYFNETYTNNSTFNYTIGGNYTPPFWVPLFTRTYPLLPCKKTTPEAPIANNSATRVHFTTLNATYQADIALLSAIINETIFWQQRHFDLLNETFIHLTMNISRQLSRWNITYHDTFQDLWAAWEKSKPAGHLLALFEQITNQKKAYSSSLQKRIKLLNETTNRKLSTLHSQIQALEATVQARFSLSDPFDDSSAEDDGFVTAVTFTGLAMGCIICCCLIANSRKKANLNDMSNSNLYFDDDSEIEVTY